MKPETFYRKFANMPIAKRSIGVLVMRENGYESHTPLGIYTSLNKAIEMQREAEKEVKRLLEIGEVITH